MELAIPRKAPDNDDVAVYSDDDTGEQGPIRPFTIACPALTNEELEIENEWRKTADVLEESQLFFLRKIFDENEMCATLKQPRPTIRKTTNICGNSQGKIHEVGYPVSNVYFI